MARPVQLAPGSLALVLSPREAGQAAGEPGGRALFRAFRRANARCFWNARLARAASRLAFLGWLRRGVLLVRAPQPCVQVLRDAWRRRALRPPRGFRITAVGNVFPVQMSLIAQRRFVPLAEVLCCVIADMNAGQVAVTQEALLEHLMKHYPGIAVPSPDILYSTLGTLIQQRKIYHTGEGYFIVTPSTYFITNTPMQGNKRALLSDEGCSGSTSGTYLVSVDCYAEPTQENEAVSHCPSCQCYPDTSKHGSKDLMTTAEVSRKRQNGLDEPTVLTKNQVVSASEDTHICVSPKPSSYTKDKGKRFGFGFLWRSLSRKEKPKAGYHSFSAQFPPEEWPVRDEDSSNNIPRDVEHAIIKRINPVLTVDNLTRHTALMQKYEEQKKYNSQGTSTDVLPSRHKYSSKEATRRRQGQAAKPHKRSCSHKGRQKAWSRTRELEPGSPEQEKEKNPKVPAAQPAAGTKSPGERVHHLHGRNPAVLGSHLIYKKQINNPFQGMHLRGHPASKGYIVQKTHKPSCIGSEEKPFRRAGFSGPSRVFDGEAQPPCLEHCRDKLEAETTHVAKAPIHPVSDDFRGGPGNYPPHRVLPSHSRCCSFRESMLRAAVYHEENKVLPEVLRKSWSDCDMFLGTKEKQVLPAQRSSLDPDSSVYAEDKTVDKTVYQFQNLGLLDCPVGANRLRTHERQDGDSEKLSRKAFQIPEAEIVNMEDEGLSDSEQDEVALSQSDPGAGDDGGCSSLCLEDDDFSETDDFCHTLPGYTQYSFAAGDAWNHLGRPTITGRSLTDCNSKTHRLEPLGIERNHWYKATGLFSNARESPNPDLADNPGLNSEIPPGFNYEGEPVVAHVQTPAAAGQSLLERSIVREASLPVEILQDSPGDRGKNPAVWRQSLPSQDMKEHFTDKLQLVNTSHVPALAQEPQREHTHLEGTENYSMAGDSGIDSPRTQSLVSTNSAVLDGFKRQNFLQTGESVQKSQKQASDSLLRLTPAINV